MLLIHYVLFLLAVAVGLYGLYHKYRVWKKGRGDDEDPGPLSARVARVWREGILQSRIRRNPYPAMMHLFIFWGMAALFVGTLVDTIEIDIAMKFFSKPLLTGTPYLVFKFILDIMGLLLIIGVVMAAYRRYVAKPEGLRENRGGFAPMHILLLLIALLGFLLEGLEQAALSPEWGVYAPVGHLVAVAIRSITNSQPQIASIYPAVWLLHSTLAMLGIASVPYTKFHHILIGPLNMLLYPASRPMGALKSIPGIEEAEKIGVERVDEFTWRQRLSFDACMECGRCQDACPAYNSKKPLSPKLLIVKLREEMYRPEARRLFDDIVSPTELWSCTSCGACINECPMLINHIDTIFDLRRFLVLTEGRVPETARITLESLGRKHNPYGLPRKERAKWLKEMDVPIASEGEEYEILYWIGCAAGYDKRLSKIAQSVIKLLRAADVKFAVLGRKEVCCGDPARRLGEEFVFEALAKRTISILKKYRFKRLLVHCPHGYNTFKNEYPRLGGEFEVVHHSQLIYELLSSGRLKLRKTSGIVTFHDPCYLGRYNKIYDEPRWVLESLGLDLAEMKRSRERSFCCGGGGGNSWYEVKEGVAISHLRLNEALETGAGMIAVACPFCLSMLFDAAKVKGVDEKVLVKDIAEILAELI